MASPTGKQSVEALASTTSLEGKWKIIITVEFTPLPKEKEEAYWAALKFFAQEIQKSLTDPAAELESVRE